MQYNWFILDVLASLLPCELSKAQKFLEEYSTLQVADTTSTWRAFVRLRNFYRGSGRRLLRCMFAHMRLELNRDAELNQAVHELGLPSRSRRIHGRYRSSKQERRRRQYRRRRRPSLNVVARLHDGYRSRRILPSGRRIQRHVLRAEVIWSDQPEMRYEEIWPAMGDQICNGTSRSKPAMIMLSCSRKWQYDPAKQCYLMGRTWPTRMWELRQIVSVSHSLSWDSLEVSQSRTVVNTDDSRQACRRMRVDDMLCEEQVQDAWM